MFEGWGWVFSYSRVEFVEGVDLIQIGGYGMWVGVGGGWIWGWVGPGWNPVVGCVSGMVNLVCWVSWI